MKNDENYFNEMVLHRFLSRDPRRLIIKRLGPYDYAILLMACGMKLEEAIFTMDFACFCAEKGYLVLLQWAAENGTCLGPELYAAAASQGKIHILEWLVARGVKKNACGMFGAACSNQESVLDWMIQHEFPFCPNSMNLICQQDKSLLLKSFTKEWDDYAIGTDFLFHALHAKQYDNARLLLDNNCWASDTLMSRLMHVADIKLLQWTMDAGIPWSGKEFTHAILKQDMVLLNFLYEKNCPRDNTACMAAAQCANIKLLEWLMQREFELNEGTFLLAVKSNSMETISWLWERDCPIDNETTLLVAIMSASDAVLNWILNVLNAPVTELAILLALDRDEWTSFELLTKGVGFELTDEVWTYMWQAHRNLEPEIISWFQQQHKPSWLIWFKSFVPRPSLCPPFDAAFDKIDRYIYHVEDYQILCNQCCESPGLYRSRIAAYGYYYSCWSLPRKIGKHFKSRITYL